MQKGTGDMTVGNRTLPVAVCLTLACCGARSARAGTTYYVSPRGRDANAGTGEDAAWRTVAKVNGYKFQPGDRILFERGGEWRESLAPTASGAAGNPVVFDAYGTGARPVFYGSVVLANADFGGDGPYTCTLPDPKPDDGYVYALEDHVFLPKASSSYDPGTGVLTLTLSSDPRTNRKVYTACVRGNVIFSNRRNHLVFRNLISDESAGEVDDGGVQGYGIRVEGSIDVLVEDCEANRSGRHNVGVINATEFVGRRIHCEYVGPEYPAGNTLYVSYADGGAPVASCTSEYIDCTAAHTGGNLFFVSHGERQGLITFRNVTAQTKVSFMSQPVVIKGGTLLEGASIENWGPGILIDGVTLKDNTAIDQWAVNGTIQNCLVDLTPKGGGPTGFGAAILCRGNANGNVIRFNTIISRGFKALVVHKNAKAQFYGNIAITDGNVFTLPGEKAIGAGELAYCDFNFYNAKPTFDVGGSRTFAEWRGFGFDQHSQAGDPGFVNAAGGDYSLAPGSAAIDAASVKPTLVPETDITGALRPANAVADIGALEADGAPPKPAIVGAAAASGTTGEPFTYQITATANAKSFAAKGLPAGLTVNTGTGVISGTPTAIGTSTVTLFATNAAGTGEKTLTLTVSEPGQTYALTVEGGTGSGSYEEGETVAVLCSPPPGQVFDRWTGDVECLANSALPSTTLTMPPRAVRITAGYRQYAAPGPMDGLVGWWRLDESEGTTASDSSGLGNHGTFVNMDPESWAPTGGLVGGALAFGGEHNHVNCGSDASLDVESLTVALWVNAEVRGNMCPIDRLPGQGVGWAVKMRDNGAIWLRVGSEPGHSPGAFDAYGPADSYVPGVWVHVAVIFDGETSELALYVDGVEKHRPTWKDTKLGCPGTPLLLGTTNKPAKEPFKGKLDDVRVYGRVLSDEEIEALAKGLASAPAAASVETVPEAEEPESVVAVEDPEEPEEPEGPSVIQDEAVPASGKGPADKAESMDPGTRVLLSVLAFGVVAGGLLFLRALWKKK
jgi:PKD repeat protein